MTNYRDFVESKLADIDRRRADIESERERLLTTLGVLDESLPSGLACFLSRRRRLPPGCFQYFSHWRSLTEVVWGFIPVSEPVKFSIQFVASGVERFIHHPPSFLVNITAICLIRLSFLDRHPVLGTASSPPRASSASPRPHRRRRPRARSQPLARALETPVALQLACRRDRFTSIQSCTSGVLTPKILRFQGPFPTPRYSDELRNRSGIAGFCMVH